ncbi:GH3 auxin-responsive promoter family protein [Cytophagales bacterium LB-30]|uniref:GH3 auxin-responsive promoter family protein n=1 Tax=Shiella aurantiaca TaxID=3058365 RepID=A0ABT8F188_9BACT|nr:GH3 auxin-responsive promoter family protein [Shiella aurantiaca]MDN4164220.1 GH3 auxin-responsive promoter family protein [Shiella aurantiaca]
MAILGTLLKQGIKLRESLDQERNSPLDLQRNELKELLKTAEDTEFGKAHGFKDLLKSADKDKLYAVFKEQVPVHSYNEMYNKWWYKNRLGQKNITWPGKVKYFALSSGTSESSSKYIPVTKDMMKSIQKTSIRQILSLSKFDIPSHTFESGILMLGGSTHLNYNGTYFEGDLSGITTGQIPFWFQHFYKPGKKIASNRSWDEKLDQITRNAKKWDIGIIAGVPAWIQILMEKIITYYGVKTIHDIWPNLKIYVHGGVSFEPYRKGFEQLLAKPLVYIETYLASEGFIAYQNKPEVRSMHLVLNNGLFYEFVPFNEENFDADGQMVSNPKTYMIDEVEENKEYAILITTCAGAWRYLIGDTVKIVNKEEAEIVITGRTKHFLSLCGEHLSVDNMNKAIELVAKELNIAVKEFTVAGIPHDTLFAHHWYVGTDDKVDSELLMHKIDEKLKELNDDYKVERSAALKEVFLDILPTKVFYDYLRHQGKEGGQNKFPRVLKKDKLPSWLEFLENQGK